MVSSSPLPLHTPSGGMDPHGTSPGGGPAPTLLPADGPDAAVAAQLRESTDPGDAARAHPASMLAWAVLADRALARATPGADVEAYAYARTGYHRGLDALRRAGWRGAGPVPWSHEPNRGFLRALGALARAARAIGEDDEAQRCDELLAACDPQAHRRVAGTSPTTSQTHGRPEA